MKLKYFLRGLGTGIIFAALVLTISYRVSDKNEMTDGQIMKRAKELGMVMQTDEMKKSLEEMQKPEQIPEKTDSQKQENEEVTSKEPENNQTEEEKQNSESNELEKDEPKQEETNDSETKVGESKDVSEDNTSESASEDEQKEEVKDYTEFTIQSGTSSAQLSRYLEGIGLVDKAESFDKYLCDNGYSGKIAVGTFKVSGNPDYAELTKVITRGK